MSVRPFVLLSMSFPQMQDGDRLEQTVQQPLEDQTSERPKRSEYLRALSIYRNMHVSKVSTTAPVFELYVTENVVLEY
jgi:hypothetical protein